MGLRMVSLQQRTLSLILPPSSLWTGRPAAFPARSQSAIPIMLMALSQGLNEPRL